MGVSILATFHVKKKEKLTSESENPNCTAKTHSVKLDTISQSAKLMTDDQSLLTARHECDVSTKLSYLKTLISDFESASLVNKRNKNFVERRPVKKGNHKHWP